MSLTTSLSRHLAVLALVLAAPVAAAADCPNVIQFSNGNYLKYGETFYYPSGNYLKYGSTLYYSNGNYLKYGSTTYYQSGNYLQYGSTLYYPNGNYLKYGSTLYYASGSYLQYGSTFYHPNGNYARYGTTLYRDNGTTTAFPITLREDIQGYGTVSARVESTAEDVRIEFQRLFADVDQVQMNAHWDGAAFSNFQFRIGSGVPGETVFLNVTDTGYECHLGGGGGGGGSDHFTINSHAAFVDVEVRPGYDAETVRRALQDALDNLRQ
jgi:hypothetical protein